MKIFNTKTVLFPDAAPGAKGGAGGFRALVIFAAAAALFAAGCTPPYRFALAGGDAASAQSVRITTAPGLILAPGETARLAAEILPAAASGAGIVWVSDNPAAAQVDAAGLVTALGEGEAEIRALIKTDVGKSASYTVRVDSGAASIAAALDETSGAVTYYAWTGGLNHAGDALPAETRALSLAALPVYENGVFKIKTDAAGIIKLYEITGSGAIPVEIEAASAPVLLSDASIAVPAASGKSALYVKGRAAVLLRGHSELSGWSGLRIANGAEAVIDSAESADAGTPLSSGSAAGSLTALGEGSGGAAIGGLSGGSLTVYGGSVTAAAAGGGAAIGGERIAVAGGSVAAVNPDESGSAIGGGYAGNAALTISGGTVVGRGAVGGETLTGVMSVNVTGGGILLARNAGQGAREGGAVFSVTVSAAEESRGTAGEIRLNEDAAAPEGAVLTVPEGWVLHTNGFALTGAVSGAAAVDPVYTITFEKGAGTGGDALVMALMGGELPVVTPPALAGYAFGGYWAAPNGAGAQYYGADGAPARAWDRAEDATLYAKWTAGACVVTFDKRGGEGGSTSVTATLAAALPSITPPSRAGYTFDGYWTEPDTAGTRYYSADGTGAKLWDRTEDTTLYARWTVNTYTVLLDKQTPGVGGTDTITVTWGETLPPASPPARAGYLFAGYWTEPGGAGTQYYTETGTGTRPWDIAGGGTLYAAWNPITYWIIYDGNGADAGEAPEGQVKTYGIPLTPLRGNTGGFVKTGYAFTGWNTAPDGSEEAYAAGGALAKDYSTAQGAVITFYARWTPGAYTVTFNSNNGGASIPASKTVAYNDWYGTLAQAERTGHTFAGWWTEQTGGEEVTSFTLVTETADHTLYAHWNVNSYTVTFDGNGGDAPVPASKSVTYGGLYGALATAARTGWTLNGWWTQSVGGTEITADTIAAMTTGQTLYAHWTLNNYTVTFDATGGIASFESKEVTYGSPYGELPAAMRAGYVFVGWVTELYGTEEIGPESLVSRAESHTLYARWLFTVTFDGNGGGTPYPKTKTFLEGSPYGSLATVSREYSSFNGWWTAPSGGEQITADDAAAGPNRTFYAHWTGVYNITFNGNGGTASLASKEVAVGGPYGTLATAARPGYVFLGWYQVPSGGEQITAETIVTLTAPHTLYAHWGAASIAASPSSVRFYNAWVAGSEWYNWYPQNANITISSSPSDGEPLALTGYYSNHPWIDVTFSADRKTANVYMHDWAVYRGGGDQYADGTTIQRFTVTLYAGSASTTITGEIWGTIDGKPKG